MGRGSCRGMSGFLLLKEVTILSGVILLGLYVTLIPCILGSTRASSTPSTRSKPCSMKPCVALQPCSSLGSSPFANRRVMALVVLVSCPASWHASRGMLSAALGIDYLDKWPARDVAGYARQDSRSPALAVHDSSGKGGAGISVGRAKTARGRAGLAGKESLRAHRA